MDKTLPLTCASRNLETGKPIFIKRGVDGYFAADETMDPNKFNEENGVTPAQREAMTIGSCFGWDVPGAYAESYEGRCPERV